MTDHVSYTEREIAVVRAVLETGTQKAAAFQLGIAVQTLKNTLRSAFVRADVQSFGQLVDAMWRQGALKSDHL